MSIKKRVRLLVIGDDESHFQLLRDSAEIWNSKYSFEVRHVETAGDALDSIQSWDPNVIMVDAFLHDMNCIEFLDRMKEGNAPLVVASNQLSTEIRDSVLARGALDYISRSPDPDEVEQLLGKLAILAVQHEELH